MKRLFFVLFLIVLFLTNFACGFSIITTNGTQFIEDNHPFYYVGFNAEVQPGGEYLNTDYTFREASRLGINVIRIWAVGEGFSDGYQPSAGVYNETTLENLDYKIATAQKYGIHLIIALANNWSDYGGIPQYLLWAGDSSGTSADFFTNASCSTFYENYVSTIINRINTVNGQPYKTDPTIFSWELMNEPRYPITYSDATLKAWITQMSNFIRSLDSTHMISTGLEGLEDATYMTGTNYTTQHRLPNISFCTFHIYPNSAGWSWSSTQTLIDDYISQGHTIDGKPVIMEEFGLSTGFSNYGLSSSYQIMLHEINTQSGNGSSLWYWNATSSVANESTINPFVSIDLPTREIFRSNANLMLKKTYGNLADLDIQPQNINFNPVQPNIGQTFYITDTVQNIGNSDASTVRVQFYAGDPGASGQQIGSDIIIPVISANSIGVVSTNWVMPGKTTDIYVDLDPYSTITELTKYNNINYRTITSQTTVFESFEGIINDWSVADNNYITILGVNSTYYTDGAASLAAAVSFPGGWNRTRIVRSPSFENDWSTYAYSTATVFIDVYCSSTVAPLNGEIIIQCNNWQWEESSNYIGSYQTLTAGWNTLYFPLFPLLSSGQLIIDSIAPAIQKPTVANGMIYIDNIRIVQPYPTQLDIDPWFMYF